jgi:hypothetical protein|tara:strand:+ start:1694 stop:2617 length:924 start_codon:yes stop_codon:yes gene_type:complete
MPPGTIRVRFLGEEVYAFPADPNRMPIPLYGEQVFCINIPAGTSEVRSQNQWYYTQILNTHGNVNNALLPFIQDATVLGPATGTDPIVKTGVGKRPEQLSFTEKDIVYIQPFQGDINYPDRFGSLLRFSSTHDPGKLDKYQNKPFWKGNKPGDPFVSITCGVKQSTEGGSLDKYYVIEDPKKDASFIYFTSTQYFDTLKFSQKKVGKDVKTLNDYKTSQVIIGADRLVFDARKDELLLVSKKDVKIATPKWQADMDEFFTQMEAFITVCIEQAQGAKPYATPSGPTGPSSALPDLQKIQTALMKMKQ